MKRRRRYSLKYDLLSSTQKQVLVMVYGTNKWYTVSNKNDIEYFLLQAIKFYNARVISYINIIM